MHAVDIIIKKRNGIELSNDEINFMIDGYTKDLIPDYQMSAFLMAIYFKGMTDSETTSLTLAMLNSGDILDLSRIKGIKVDKHSTGGVGDKTSLVVAPLVASLGIKFAKMSGRGLGHTGGTLDKLEAIPGFNVSLSDEEFINQVNEIGVAIIGQTKSLAPADKKMYALRDVTGTVDSIPLIASSIMSKKLAAGTDVIDLDVKVGSGAFMKDEETATILGETMVRIGKMMNKKVTAVLTNMDEPLGLAVGNSLEVIEAINTLNGNGPKDFTELCMSLSANIIHDCGLTNTIEEARKLAEEQIRNGKAKDTFVKMVHMQSGDESYILNPKKFRDSKYHIDVKSKKTGIVSRIDALKIGEASMYLGAGREQLTDVINPAVGIVLNKKVGDKVSEGETLLTLYSDTENPTDSFNMAFDAYEINDSYVYKPLIIKTIK